MVRANSLIWFRTTSIPRSSEAFSSRKFICQVSPKNSRASATAAVVLPTPAGPVKRRWGRLPLRTYTLEPLDDLVLADDLGEAGRPVALDPDGVIGSLHACIPVGRRDA